MSSLTQALNLTLAQAAPTFTARTASPIGACPPPLAHYNERTFAHFQSSPASSAAVHHTVIEAERVSFRLLEGDPQAGCAACRSGGNGIRSSHEEPSP